MSRSLRANKGGPTSTPKVAPSCPYHGDPMVFAAERMCWTCTHEGCAIVSWPKIDVESGKPTIVRGEVEVVRVSDRVYIRAQNVLIDVTDVFHDLQKIKGVYALELRIKSAVETDGYERTDIE